MSLSSSAYFSSPSLSDYLHDIRYARSNNSTGNLFIPIHPSNRLKKHKSKSPFLSSHLSLSPSHFRSPLPPADATEHRPDPPHCRPHAARHQSRHSTVPLVPGTGIHLDVVAKTAAQEEEETGGENGQSDARQSTHKEPKGAAERCAGAPPNQQGVDSVFHRWRRLYDSDGQHTDQHQVPG